MASLSTPAAGRSAAHVATTLRDRAWPYIVCAALLAGIMLWPGRASLPPIDRDESRYAQATRQMLESGDLLDLRFQDQPRYVQPIGAYWMQAVAVRLFGDPSQRVIWPHRIPSLLAGMAAAALTCAVGARLFGRRAALVGAALFVSTLLFNFEARIATTDATLLAFVLLGEWALLAVWQARDGPERSRWPAVAFWIALGCSVMVKGPAGVVVIGLTALTLATTTRNWPWLRRLHPDWGVVLLLAIVAPWMIAIAIRSHGAFFTQSVGHNMLGKLSHGQESHGSPPGYYLVMFVAMFWPGSLLTVQAIPTVWANRRTDRVRFLLCWIVPSWLVFECVPTKLPHYVLPTYPAIALLSVAALAVVPPARWRRVGFAVVFVIWGAVGLVIAAGLPVVVWKFAHTLDMAAVGASAVGIALLGAMAWHVYGGRQVPAALCGIAAAAAIHAGTFGRLLPELSPIWISARVARLVQAVRPCPGTPLVSASYNEPSLVFLLGTQTRLADPITAAEMLAHDPGCGLALVADQALPPFLAVLGAHHLQPRDLGAVHGLDYSNNRRLDLHVFAIAPQGAR